MDPEYCPNAEPTSDSKAEEPAEEPVALPQRDSHGRFVPGCNGGPGNPFARRTAGLRRAIANAVSEEDIAQIVLLFKRKALEGDLAAAKFIFSYAVGRPAPAVNPDTLDHEEFVQFERDIVPPERVQAAATGMTSNMASHLTSCMRQGLEVSWSRQLYEVLKMPDGSEAAVPQSDPHAADDQGSKKDSLPKHTEPSPGTAPAATPISNGSNGSPQSLRRAGRAAHGGSPMPQSGVSSAKNGGPAAGENGLPPVCDSKRPCPPRPPSPKGVNGRGGGTPEGPRHDRAGGP
jgi:hypothetical protein